MLRFRVAARGGGVRTRPGIGTARTNGAGADCRSTRRIRRSHWPVRRGCPSRAGPVARFAGSRRTLRRPRVEAVADADVKADPRRHPTPGPRSIGRAGSPRGRKSHWIGPSLVEGRCEGQPVRTAAAWPAQSRLWMPSPAVAAESSRRPRRCLATPRAGMTIRLVAVSTMPSLLVVLWWPVIRSRTLCKWPVIRSRTLCTAT